MSVSLGRTSVDYVFTVASTTVTAFLSVARPHGRGVLHPCARAGPEPDAAGFHAVLRCITELRGVLLKLVEKCDLRPKKAIGYIADCIVRNLCLPHWGGSTQ